MFSEFEKVVEKTHLALKEFYMGNPDPYDKLLSQKENVSLLGAQGGVSVGLIEVRKHLTSRASWFRAGHDVSFERIVTYSNKDMGYIVEVERFEAKVAGSDEGIPIALRVTTIFGYEDGEWRVAHRQGDPLVSRIDPSTYISLSKHNLEKKE